MKASAIAVGILLATTAAEAAPELRCETGPVSKMLGGTDWLVYSCDDRRSMLVVSADKNPARPFYFLLTPLANSYHVAGEGNGNKQASDAAGDELSRMTAADFAKLLAATTVSPARN
jgi:hypothetical protein